MTRNYRLKSVKMIAPEILFGAIDRPRKNDQPLSARLCETPFPPPPPPPFACRAISYPRRVHEELATGCARYTNDQFSFPKTFHPPIHPDSMINPPTRYPRVPRLNGRIKGNNCNLPLRSLSLSFSLFSFFLSFVPSPVPVSALINTLIALGAFIPRFSCGLMAVYPFLLLSGTPCD